LNAENEALLSGRHRPLPGIVSSKPNERAEAERKAINTLVQGTAADLMKTAMLRWIRAVSEVGGAACRLQYPV